MTPINTEWHDFLNNADAGADPFPRAEPAAHPAVCGLTGYGVLKVWGEEAATFLQGQTTCDVNAVEPGRVGIGALCTPKGRVIANFRLLRANEGVYLLLAADLAETVQKRLRMFVLRSKVVVEDWTPRYGVIGLFGVNDAPSIPELGAVALPDGPGAWLETPDYLALRLDDGSSRVMIAAELDAARRLWTDLSRRFPLGRPEFWRLKDIEAGYPEVTAPVAEEFLPQMLNLDALGGISFRKGCYTGQEIVTRTHFLGQVKRRMFRLRCGGDAPVPGTPVFEISNREPKTIGQVVMSAPESATHSQLLAVLATDCASSPAIHVGSPAGPSAEWLALPYGFDAPPGPGPTA